MYKRAETQLCGVCNKQIQKKQSLKETPNRINFSNRHNKHISSKNHNETNNRVCAIICHLILQRTYLKVTFKTTSQTLQIIQNLQQHSPALDDQHHPAVLIVIITMYTENQRKKEKIQDGMYNHQHHGSIEMLLTVSENESIAKVLSFTNSDSFNGTKI